MNHKKWDLLFIPHTILLLWAILFLGSLHLSDGGKTAGILATGNYFFLFVNIPFSIFSIILKAKGCFSKKWGIYILVFSILNILVGIAGWSFAVLLVYHFWRISPTMSLF